MTPTPQEEVDNILAGMPVPTGDLPKRNAVASNPRLAEAVAYCLDKIRSGELRISLSRLYNEKLRAAFNGPRAFDTVKTYVRLFLRRDFITGEDLE